MPDASPRRGGSVPLQWHLARWREAEPGRRGILWMGVLTLLICIPFERFGADLAWSSQASIFLNVSVVLASVVIGREAALPDDVELWLVNQGYSPADWVLSRWIANLLPLVALSIVWALAVAAVTLASGQEPSWRGLIGLVAQLAAAAAVLTLVMLVVGAAGVRQTSEVLLIVLIITVLLPLADGRLPAVLVRGLQLVLPPINVIVRFRDGLVNAAWRDASLALLHLATWSAVALSAALALAHRRVPERPSRGIASGR